VNDKLGKVHTKEYQHLKEIARRLDSIWTKAQGHSPRTVASVRRDLNRQWDAHVTHLIANGSPVGTINAARVRLEKGKSLLAYLDG
jgi:hypothetical protein